jgi:Ca2+-transporting ATPase
LRKRIKQGHLQKAQAWHGMDTTEVIARLGTSPSKGLTGGAAGDALKLYGPNLLPEAVPPSGFKMFITQFKSLPVALLGAAIVVSLATGGVADAAVIASVIMINAFIGYTTESQAEKTIRSMKSLVTPLASVVRDGSVNEIKASDVVPGDLILLRHGSYVPADARLVETNYLSIDESALTGESMPAAKGVDAIIDAGDTPLADRHNMVYMGTLVTGGQGTAIVVATGRFTEIGVIQGLAGEAQQPATPMELQLEGMGRQLVAISGITCGLVFLAGLLRGYGFLEMLKTSISLAVAAVPEGLPTVATTTLALGIRRMRRKNVLVRRLEAVEALGSVQTICLDKTGTLTRNSMSVVALHAGMEPFTVDAARIINGARGSENPYRKDELLRLLHMSVLCNESQVRTVSGVPVITGSPTENALIEIALSSGVNVEELRNRHPLRKIVYRSENRNYIVTVHDTGREDGRRLIAIKGSPAEVLPICGSYRNAGSSAELGDDERAAIEEENDRMSGMALRVLAVAYALLEEDETLDFLEGMESVLPRVTWLGLVGMADPIRDGVPGLIGSFHRAGIDTVMITGDQSSTAYAIGKVLNLSNNGQLEILDSSHLTGIDPELLKTLCKRVHVFSRVSPAHKLQIVRALQASGKVVAMTGDGINDSPALKASNIGIAMGKTGTDVAREVADVVIEDDRLETMILAVHEGRTIYNNIRKALHYLLSTNFSEIMVMGGAVTFGMGQPLNTMQLLWINLISDIFPGLALALDPPEPDVLSEPPRDPGLPIVGSSTMKRILFESSVISAGGLAAYGYGIARYGQGPQAGTLAFSALSLGQVLHALICRSRNPVIFGDAERAPNRYLKTAVGGSLLLQGLTFVIPGLRGLLRLTPVSVMDGAVIALCSTLPLVANDLTKRSAIPGIHSKGSVVATVQEKSISDPIVQNTATGECRP